MRQLVLLALLSTTFVRPVKAQVVFSNDFQSNTTGFTASGSLTTLGRTTLPTDNGGLASANQSMWLGLLGSGVAKSGASDEIVTLSLAGLATGQVYSIAFDLLVGASWDGSASGFGPDSWRLVVDGTALVNTTFSNGQQGVNVGAYSPQRYSDATSTSTTGPDFNRFTGADAFFSLNQNGNYASDYAIYYFGHGSGNPNLTFTATGTTAALSFARYGQTTDSADEYWALDNVKISIVPEPSSLWLLILGGGLFLASERTRNRRLTVLPEHAL
jgi:hypothetical protein